LSANLRARAVVVGRSAARLRFLSLLLPLASGCIFFVGGGDLGETCTFDGRDEEPCGRCVAEHCQEAVNTCCGDRACERSLDLLDACASGDSCYELERAQEARPLASCIEEACSDACDVRMHSRLLPASTACEVQSSYCSCTVPGPPGTEVSEPNGVACGAATFARAICCASSDWPQELSECTCFDAVCTTYSNACICELTTSNDPVFQVDLCTRGACCMSSDGSCGCTPESSSCFDGDTRVESCSTAQVDCGPDRRGVESCSAP
jgi:hypothetical protein